MEMSARAGTLEIFSSPRPYFLIAIMKPIRAIARRQ